jgi:methylated-DNA-[protein]-cysteine S-methyltransferase
VKDENVIYWDSFTHDGMRVHVAASSHGLCLVTFPNQGLAALSTFAKRRGNGACLCQDPEKMKDYVDQVKGYLTGEHTPFTLPLDLQGTPFQLSVWQNLRQIPYGRTASYSDIARDIGKPAAVRAVGAAIGRNTVAYVVPCHRVIGKNGALTGYRGGLDNKLKLLQMESRNL